ncbi:hypothetical protein CANCADRAFT_125726 [Tortispora caseinolytica NRRL Y-17796]|uniref:Uncharacterized protein n=1 Tax=Tortispora caseinolytica NRRL Y-17796 TaxID=767744 RepID=A0A1E4TA69_9ASCO|nr:hypothetical protein CANCADRAFT_125726 [Tortispora caseinolytica NRRL Y-17796]
METSLRKAWGSAEIDDSNVIKTDSGYVLIQIQGTIHGLKNGNTLGDVTINEDQSKAWLKVGHQLLEGSLTKLNPPLAVVKSSATAANADIIAIINKQIIFSTRPELLVD